MDSDRHEFAIKADGNELITNFNKQDAAWCHDHGYASYATKDCFCVGAGGKLIKVGLQGVYS